jgi:hypothetical protein
MFYVGVAVSIASDGIWFVGCPITGAQFFCFSLQDLRITTKVISSIGRWLKIINWYTPNQKKNEKSALAVKIVSAWRKQYPPGRFLQRDEKGKWYDVGDKKAREKTSQALREKAPKQDEFVSRCAIEST